jgi:hypothetical protein
MFHFRGFCNMTLVCFVSKKQIIKTRFILIFAGFFIMLLVLVPSRKNRIVINIKETRLSIESLVILF